MVVLSFNLESLNKEILGQFEEGAKAVDFIRMYLQGKE